MASHPIAVSLKARGLSVLEKSFAVGFREFWPQAGAETLDLGVAIAVNVVLLTWSTWFSVILTILSLCFYAFFKNGQVATEGSLMMPVAFLIYLPTLWLAYMTNSRRLEAARQLQAVQSHVIGMYVVHAGLASCGAAELLSQLDDAISDTMGQLQGYLAHPRPISSHHLSPSSLRAEHLPVKSRLFVLGRDIGQRLRRLHSCQRRLSAVSAALLEHCSGSKYPQQQQHTQLVLTLVQQLMGLTQAIAALTTIKDLRSPLLLRVMLRAGCVLLAPLITGSWLAGLAYEATPPGQLAGAVGMVFGIVVGAILQVLLMSLLTLGLLLEDPFDTAGALAAPDTISLLEFNHTMAYLTAPPNTEEESIEDNSLDPEQQQQQPETKYQHQIVGFVAAQQQQRQEAVSSPEQATQQQQQQQQESVALQQPPTDVENPAAFAAVAASGVLDGGQGRGLKEADQHITAARGWGYHSAAASGRQPSGGAVVTAAAATPATGSGTSAVVGSAGSALWSQQQQQQQHGGRSWQRASPMGSPTAAVHSVSMPHSQLQHPSGAVGSTGEVEIDVSEAPQRSKALAGPGAKTCKPDGGE